MATSHDLPNVSADLIWSITEKYNSYLVKRSDAGGVQFSRDPLNLTNVHHRKHAGFVNEKAFGVQGGEKGRIHLVSKGDKHSSPAQNQKSKTIAPRRSNRNVYKDISATVAGDDYRPDLVYEAVARASALRRATREKKPKPAPKRVRTKKGKN